MSSYCVRKPYTVVVAVIMVLVLGVISFFGMTTDLLPTLELPYIVVVTTYPGADPERVETGVTAVLESGLGTVNGVSNVQSVSSENMSMVILEFEESTNMDSAMVKLSSAVDQVKGALPETASEPMLLEISPDMLPVMVASVDCEGSDAYGVSQVADETVVPYFERQAGVASVSASGLVEHTVEIRLSQQKIDDLNTKVLASVDGALADALAELSKASAEVASGKQELADGKAKLEAQQSQTADALAQTSAQVDAAVAQLESVNANVANLTASQKALETEKAGMEQAAAQTAQLDAALGALSAMMPGVPASCADVAALDDTAFAAFQQTLSAAAAAQPELAAAAAMTRDQWQTLADAPQRVTEIDAELSNIATQLVAAEAVKQQTEEALKQAQEAYKKLEAGKIQAAAGFGSGAAQIAAGETALQSAEAELETAREQFNEQREAALESADVTKLLTMDTVKNLITAQNFSMPAGYLYEGETQYLLKIGEEFSSVEELENTVLMHMDADGVGDVRLSDVADITLLDTAGDTYAKVNGNDAVLLTISKSSTASTSDVSKALNSAIEELEAENEGLHITPLMDQGDYIEMITGSVLSNLAWGGVLAILVLALFLKDVRPTFVVAMSIPISLTFAVVLMYFTGVTLNIISLSGLALGVGMLVDNSIVVIENIYRLRAQGMPAPKAAVRGAKQVAGAIIASTLTTVCVFLPIVFTEGLTRQLFSDMGLTIAYSLLASLIVALTVVPSLSSNVLRSAAEKRHPWFDAFVNGYERVLRWCLAHKAAPIAGALALLALAVWQTGRMGLEFIPEMSAAQMSMTVTMPDGTEQSDAYAMADEVMSRTAEVPGVETVGAMNGGGMAVMGMGSGGSSDSFTFYLLLDDDGARDNAGTAAAIEEATAGLGCTVEISSSSMDLSALGASGMSVEIRGRSLETMTQIADDVIEMLNSTEGLANATDGQEDGSVQLNLSIDRDAAMRSGLTVAQIYADLASALTTETTTTSLYVDGEEYTVKVVDERGALSRSNLMDYEFETSAMGADGQTETETHTLGEFASVTESRGMASINRDNQTRVITVSAETLDGYNTSLVARGLQDKLDAYDVPDGYTVEIAGEVTTISDAMGDLVLMILLAVVFIYLIMVAQFQSLLSPFIVMFTMPLAFTGGLLGLVIARSTLSVVSMIGFLVLAGVVVNNGIVFVDYTNQLRLEGMDKREALVETGRARIRPILMTALTTILAMCTMLFATEPGSEMMRPMAIVTIGGLSYATLLTLLIVPVLYDILFRRELEKIDVGEEDEA